MMKRSPTWEDSARAASSEKEFGEIFAPDYYGAESFAISSDARQPYFRLAKSEASPVPVGRFSGYAVGVRRTWKDIRQGPSNIYIVWFPLEGSISITQDEASGQDIRPGQMAITCGDRPFHIKAMAEEGETHCSNTHLVVPKHLMHTCLPEVDRLCGKPFAADAGEAAIARGVFESLFDESSKIPLHASSKLAHAALQVLADYVRDCSKDRLKRDPRHAQLERLLLFVRQHISQQGLSVEQVAKGCNISRRYVHYLMKMHGMSFGEFLKECRLEQAHHWLTREGFESLNIVDIAYKAGFNNASYFSQAYRARYGVSPSEARRSGS